MKTSCPKCGTEFEAPTYRFKNGNKPHCSISCSKSGRVVKPLLERFWDKVVKSDGCWIWVGTLRPDGYGVIGIGRREEGLTRAHVLSWTLVNGEVPAGMCLCHKCDTPPCVRPDHMFIGTKADNARDRDKKDRVQHGVGHYAAKIGPKEVRAMRKLRESGMIYREIGEAFGLSRNGASHAIRGLTWKRVK